MVWPNLYILYVEDPQKSEVFYRELFKQAAVEKSETFVMFQFDSGWQLGLWRKQDVLPQSQAVSQCGEFAMAVETQALVDDYDYIRVSLSLCRAANILKVDWIGEKTNTLSLARTLCCYNGCH